MRKMLIMAMVFCGAMAAAQTFEGFTLGMSEEDFRSRINQDEIIFDDIFMGSTQISVNYSSFGVNGVLSASFFEDALDYISFEYPEDLKDRIIDALRFKYKASWDIEYKTVTDISYIPYWYFKIKEDAFSIRLSQSPISNACILLEYHYANEEHLKRWSDYRMKYREEQNQKNYSEDASHL